VPPRIQEYSEYKALLEGIKTTYGNPARTSRKPPNGKKLKFINYKFVQLRRYSNIERRRGLMEPNLQGIKADEGLTGSVEP